MNQNDIHRYASGLIGAIEKEIGEAIKGAIIRHEKRFLSDNEIKELVKPRNGTWVVQDGNPVERLVWNGREILHVIRPDWKSNKILPECIYVDLPYEGPVVEDSKPDISEFHDQHIQGCEINECEDGKSSAFLDLMFDKPLGGVEVLLTEDELERILKKVKEANLDPLSLEFDDPISTWFELSYAQFLTVPRLVMEAMPIEWQKKMADLLFEMDETFDWRPKDGRYWVKLRDGNGRFTHAPLCDYRHGRQEIEELRIKPEENCGS